MHPAYLIASVRSDAVFEWILTAIFGSICYAPAILLLIVMVQQIGRPPPQDRLGHGFIVTQKVKPEHVLPSKEDQPTGNKKE